MNAWIRGWALSRREVVVTVLVLGLLFGGGILFGLISASSGSASRACVRTGASRSSVRPRWRRAAPEPRPLGR